ncbi:carbamoyltransferase HypF [bacterium]|nr:carbamoyltransferase HypF [bacterium]
MQDTSSSGTVHYELRVSGIVQGVGFRPFVFVTANRYGLKGEVWNDSSGVGIRVQGQSESVNEFMRSIHTEHPPIAKVTGIADKALPLAEYGGFSILKSVSHDHVQTHIPPDLAVCSECKAELKSGNARRSGHLFINCTQCGPRFTIIDRVPYDRPFTSMGKFAMCPECEQEYSDPGNRRFHAQPTCCNSCGPHLRMHYRAPDGSFEEWSDETAINRMAQLLAVGGVGMIQGIGGFHLICDATNSKAVRRIRRSKRRERKPLAVMFPCLESLRDHCLVSVPEVTELESPRAPIVLIQRQRDSNLSGLIAPGSRRVGAMLPYTPLHLSLLEEIKYPVVMTSANRSDEPTLFRTDEAMSRWGELCDGILVHDRPIRIFADDSVTQVSKGRARVIRRARGFVPEPIRVPMRFKQSVVAVGADLKNTVAFGSGDTITISQHIGDLACERTREAAMLALNHLGSLLNIHPERVAHDLHPDYLSTAIARHLSRNHSLPATPVQHHHAHLAACLAEHGYTGKAVGVILDGTGYGLDRTVWGGELLFGDIGSFRRAGHLESVPLIGGDLAATQPWRMALAWLHRSCPAELEHPRLPFIKKLIAERGEAAIEFMRNILNSNQCILTSSAGRLFDAVAALTGYGTGEQFEGEAAMWLEEQAVTNDGDAYPFDIQSIGGTLVLSPGRAIQAICDDVHGRCSVSSISQRFHAGFANGWTEMAFRALAENHCNTVALSGGCFQNRFLLELMMSRLEKDGVQVLVPERVPMNDGGISFGQACVACMRSN